MGEGGCQQCSQLRNNEGVPLFPWWPLRGKGSPLGLASSPPRLKLLPPELYGLCPTQLPACLQQRDLLIGAKLAGDDFQPVVVPLPAGWPKAQHLPAIAEPPFLRCQQNPLAGLGAHHTSGAHPRCLTRSSVQPGQRETRCSPWAISPWCSWQESSGMQLGPAWWRNQWQVMHTFDEILGPAPIEPRGSAALAQATDR